MKSHTRPYKVYGTQGSITLFVGVSGELLQHLEKRDGDAGYSLDNLNHMIGTQLADVHETLNMLARKGDMKQGVRRKISCEGARTNGGARFAHVSIEADLQHYFPRADIDRKLEECIACILDDFSRQLDEFDRNDGDDDPHGGKRATVTSLMNRLRRTPRPFRSGDSNKSA